MPSSSSDPGMSGAETNAAWAERARAAFTPNVSPAPLVLERGEGCYLWDVEGQRYLDAISGIAVCALGHGHPGIQQAIAEQAGRLMHTSNLFLNRPSVRLAERISAHCFGERVFFCNSGAEANESAIKMARRYHFGRGDEERTRIISFRGGFHGRTYGALAATAQPKYHEGFGPMPEGFDYVDYGDLEGVRSVIGARTAAILVEPIQGEGGVNVPSEAFLGGLRALADEAGALLICDEVQTGFGRTGKWFAHQHTSVRPDIMSMAKGIAGGMPLGAVTATAEVSQGLQPGTHNTTYSGNPVACAAAHVVLDALEHPGFLEQIERSGRQLREGLAERAGALFAEVRGQGLLVGAQLKDEVTLDAKAIVAACRARGLLIFVAGPRVVRFAPPLIMGEAEIQEALDRFAQASSDLGSTAGV